MSQKQDRINEVLAERISQLETELRNAVTSKDRAERETRLVKDEAYEVVGQWSAENAELRRKVSLLDQEHDDLRAAVANREETIACLKEELTVAQQLSAQFSATAEENQQQNKLLTEKLEEKTAALTDAQAALSAANQQVGNYERLVSKFEIELKGLIVARKADEQAIAELRRSLEAANSENSVLRKAGEDVATSTGKLLERVRRLKDENDALERRRSALTDENAALKQKLLESEEDGKKQLVKIGELSESFASAAAEVERLTSELSETERRLEETSAARESAEAAAAQQLELIQNLESDMQELRDTAITTGKVVDDLQAELEFTKQQLDACTREKDSLNTEFETVKECYSNVLLELDDHKRSSAKTIEAMQNEFAHLQKELAAKLSSTETNNRAAWTSIQELTATLHAQQRAELVKQEQLARYSTAAEQQAGWASVLEQRLRLTSQLLSATKQIADNHEMQISKLELSAASTSEALATATNQCRLNEQALVEHRRAFSALESQLSQCTARLQECTVERDALRQDNEWLKSQVESMRQELGELDEILNSNLNEMREENEKLQLDGNSLRQKLHAAEESAAAASAAAQRLKADIHNLESEARAQTKTLEITEAELQAAKAQTENASTSLQYAQKQLEELAAANDDLTKANHLLSSQNAELKECLGNQDSKLALILADKRKESEALKVKMNSVVEKYEKTESLLRAESAAKKETEAAHAAAKEHNLKLRGALDELKARCASDAAALKELLSERDDLMRDRELIVEKYNKLHDTFRSVRKEAHTKVADELRRVMELAMSQESELQTLRKENVTLKKSVSMFVESAQPKAEAIFMERLNLTEGPLRHPKKRNTASVGESKE